LEVTVPFLQGDITHLVMSADEALVQQRSKVSTVQTFVISAALLWIWLAIL
jgi:hypothetical protein